VWDGPAEARIISGDIENWKSKGRSYNDVAILVRASRQMRNFEERFIQLGLPYRVIGGPRFFERAEIRDAHAYLRVLRSNTDDLAFERIINTPKRGIGATSVRKLQDAARSMNISIEAATRTIIRTDEIRGKARSALRAFMLDLDRWRKESEDAKHTEMAERILDQSGYTQMWRDNKDAKSQGRLDNLKELINAMGEFDTLDAYMEHVSLVMDVETGPQEDEISLMTLHSAKGLEFPLVFLPGWEEGTFPSQRSLDESGMAGLEEERRLAYVGITRAREMAKIYFAANRQLYGSWQSSLPSRFVDELPIQHVDVESEANQYNPSLITSRVQEDFSRSFTNAQNAGRTSPGWERYKNNKDKSYGRAPKDIEGHAVRRPAKGKSSNYMVGERVFHNKFGYGAVKATEGTKLTVEFEKAGEKMVLDGFVQRASEV
jgi:DNA helicase-2/ATP-dependent DNA helicase PcrA